MVGSAHTRYLATALLSLACSQPRREPVAVTAPPLRTPSQVPPPAAVLQHGHADAATPLPAPADRPALAPPGAHRPPADLNVVMLSIDSLRADMPWAGYPRPIAPFLTDLESRSVSFTHAYALSSYTSMSVGGFLGGRLPGELRRDGYFFGTYPASDLMFPERLQAAGIRTLAAQAHGYFRPGHAGFDQGFDVWELIPGLVWNPTTDVEITGDRHAALARRLLSDPANTSHRFFAWFHFLDPHDEYRAHPGIGPYGHGNRDRYDAEVTWTDRQVADLLTWIQQQPWGSRTAIVITADHGEAFGEHGEYRHGFELYQELVRVPWFFMVPGASARRIVANRSHLDLAPTMLDLFGLPPDPGFTGHSLVPEIYGAEALARDVLVDLPRTSDNDRRRALVHEDLKLIAFGDDSRFELYNLATDPDEHHNLVRDPGSQASLGAMMALYRAAQATLHDVAPYACRTLRGAPSHPAR